MPWEKIPTRLPDEDSQGLRFVYYIAMVHDILCIGSVSLNAEEMREALSGEGGGEVEIRRAASMEEAEPYLYENRVCLVIADSSVTGILEWLSALKNDEMLRIIPIIVIVAESDAGTMKSAFSFGIDNVIDRKSAETLLSTVVKPLIRSYLFNEDIQSKISELHEAAIHDFILVDLIKDYIPRTIWDIAKAYAHLQKIAIPEEETELTVVFADIKGFSEMTQHMPPRDVIRTLNTVFDVATRIVYQAGGDIDKFIGDAFFAVYRDAKVAVESMVQLQRELKEMNAREIQEGRRPIQFRIGIHTGPVIRGNVGGNHRYDNTLIGDTVNMASRLESLAPAGGIIISEETRKKARLSIPQSSLRRERLRGRDVEDTIYEVFQHMQ